MFPKSKFSQYLKNLNDPDYGSAAPDPKEIFMDPEHWFLGRVNITSYKLRKAWAFKQNYYNPEKITGIGGS